jgi:hypothetical protein
MVPPTSLASVNQENDDTILAAISKGLPFKYFIECRIEREKRGFPSFYVYRLYSATEVSFLTAKAESSLFTK